jgi:hypothetical protein
VAEVGDGMTTFELTLSTLRARGAQAFDPVRFRYIEALVRRAAAHGGEARRVLDRKLLQALATYRDRFESASVDAGQALTGLVQRFAAAAGELHRLHDSGDFRALHGLAARLEAQARRGPLVDLVACMDRHAAAPGGTAATPADAPPAGAPTELRALRQFRSTWVRLGVEQQLTRSLASVPENPGPLNSHLLMQRALRRMQDISPAYLSRFMSHAEALLWLDQASVGSASTRDHVASREGDKKRKPGRVKRL